MCFELTSPLLASHRQFAKGVRAFQCLYTRISAIYVRIPCVSGVLRQLPIVTEWLTSSYYVPAKSLLATYYIAARRAPRSRVLEEGNKKEVRTDDNHRGPQHPGQKECNDILPARHTNDT